MSLKVVYNRRHNPRLLPLHISNCNCCYHWERGPYIFEGMCRIYPYPRREYRFRCDNWSNIFEWLNSRLYSSLKDDTNYYEIWQKEEQKKRRYKLTEKEKRKNIRKNKT